MNAAKKVRKLIAGGENPDQVAVLKDLLISLQADAPFQMARLYQIDMRYFDIAIALISEWRLDHHIATRGKLMEQFTAEMMRAGVSA
jgi:hypothetical protein